ncbi:MAG: hypothetical protein IKI58_10715 [Oscillospiraceae bacterium]|nr:hypothetical protein [Oscillospiraceae bacterium]
MKHKLLAVNCAACLAFSGAFCITAQINVNATDETVAPQEESIVLPEPAEEQVSEPDINTLQENFALIPAEHVRLAASNSIAADKSVLNGDMNGDGEVNEADADAIAETTYEKCPQRVDVPLVLLPQLFVTGFLCGNSGVFLTPNLCLDVPHHLACSKN